MDVTNSKPLKRRSCRSRSPKRGKKSNLQISEVFDASNPNEITSYSPSTSHDPYDSSSENLENINENSYDQDVFANLDGAVKEENFSDGEQNVIKEVYVKGHSRSNSQWNSDGQSESAQQSSSQSADNNILKHIMIKLDRITSTNEHNFRIISAQNNEIIKQQISINSQLRLLDKRIQRIENKLHIEVKIDDFTIDVINNVEELKEFLSNVQNDQEYSSKCTVYLHKHCPKGSSKHTHYGVIKGIIDKLFSPYFKNCCGWASEKTKKNSENQSNVKSNRVLLSEHYTFQKLILDILNFNSVESFTIEHVAEGIKEYYKRFPRKAIDSETEGISITSIEEKIELRRERDRIRMQLKRLYETPEQREARRISDAARQRRRRESEQNRLERLKAERIRQAIKRKNETEEERKIRRDKDKLRQTLKRNSETEEERRKRLELQRIRQAKRRGTWIESKEEQQEMFDISMINNVKMEPMDNFLNYSVQDVGTNNEETICNFMESSLTEGTAENNLEYY